MFPLIQPSMKSLIMSPINSSIHSPKSLYVLILLIVVVGPTVLIQLHCTQNVMLEELPLLSLATLPSMVKLYPALLLCFLYFLKSSASWYRVTVLCHQRPQQQQPQQITTQSNVMGMAVSCTHTSENSTVKPSAASHQLAGGAHRNDQQK